MFYVYSPAGRVFAGRLENLRRVERPEHTTHQKQIFGDELDADELKHTDRYQVSEKAVAEYQAMLKSASAKEAAYHAYQVMSQPVVSIQASDSCIKAFELFEQVSYQVIPILDSRNHLIAALSRRMFYQRLFMDSINLNHSDLSVLELTDNCQRSVISANPVTDIRRIASVMVDRSLDAVPIVEESHHLVGIVSRTDILKCVTKTPPLSMWC